MSLRHPVASLADLPPGTGKAFTVAGRQLALFNVNGHLYAVDNVCPHDGAPLAEGTVEGTTLTCPWHSAEFDLTSGQVLCPPATEDIQRFPVFVKDGTIEVEL